MTRAAERRKPARLTRKDEVASYAGLEVSDMSHWWRTSASARLVLFALLVAAFLFACRLLIFRYADGGREAVLQGVAMDALAVGIVLAAALVIAGASRPAAATFLLAAAAYLMIAGAINVRIIDIYRQPATVNLLRYGDFLSAAGLRSLTKYASWVDKLLLAVAIACLAGFAALRALQSSRAFAAAWAAPALSAATAVVLAVLPIYAMLQPDRSGARHANAGWWLIKSAIADAPVAEVRNPDLRDPFETYVSTPGAWVTTPARVQGADIDNVIVIVLESVGSEYVDLRRADGPAPNLRRLLPQSAYFPNAYAPMPSSPAALFSLMTGMYPPVSPLAIPIAEPDFPAETLLDGMRRQGKRTAVFSANWGFMDFGRYLKAGGAEHVEEIADRQRCAVAAAASEAKQQDVPGDTEQCTFDALRRWIGQSAQDFGAMLWTYRTHYPYGADPSELAANPDRARRNYLNEIAETDRLIGSLVDWLDRENRLESTLLVVVGDHGEAFFQHGSRAHGNDIHEESVRVPLLFVNKRVFDGAIDPAPVRLIDVAPTLLTLTGSAPPPTSQGVDLTGPLRPRRVFFAASWLNLVLGFREGARKYEYAFVPDRLRAFDVARDPGESSDRAHEMTGDERTAAVRRILNWKSAVDAKTAAARASGG